MSRQDRVRQFRQLHRDGTFVMPNPHDLGAARLLALSGFPALATTSAGLANSLGRLDSTVTREELVAHVGAVAGVTDLPLNVDAEWCFPGDPGGVGATIEQLAEAGAAGCSIEDWNPVEQRLEPVELAVERVAEAAAAAQRVDLVLTVRCEGLLRRLTDLDQTVQRLRRYVEAGGECAYAPGVADPDQIRRLVGEVGAPLNVLAVPGGPTVADLAALGVRRISTGHFLASIAYGALAAAARRLAEDGSLSSGEPYLPHKLGVRAFGG
jgi:2-methylisocitrate lyase-like PEP mutase family enzyme